MQFPQESHCLNFSALAHLFPADTDENQYREAGFHSLLLLGIKQDCLPVSQTQACWFSPLLLWPQKQKQL